MKKVGWYDDCMEYEEAAIYTKTNPATFYSSWQRWGIQRTLIAGKNWFRKCDLDRWLATEVGKQREHKNRETALFRDALQRQMGGV
jgi:hypothetical protein